MRCSNCKKEIDKDFEFCGFCGSQNVNIRSSDSYKFPKKPHLLIGVSTALIVIILFVLFFNLSSGDSLDNQNWQRAVSENTAASYNKYLSDPEGAHSSEARIMINYLAKIKTTQQTLSQQETEFRKLKDNYDRHMLSHKKEEYSIESKKNEPQSKRDNNLEYQQTMISSRGQTGYLKMPLTTIKKMRIGAIMSGPNNDERINVLGFSVRVPGQPTVIIKGDRLNDTGLRILNKARRGDYIVFYDLKQQLTSNVSYKLKPALPLVVEVVK